MVCRSCGAENRPGRKFCAQCGNAIATSCPVCRAINEPGERFCGDCGAPLEAQPDAAAEVTRRSGPSPARPQGPVAERRLVSVLFTDLVGFTSISEERDPEEVRELLTRYFNAAREIIERYGGGVEKFIGDAVMAVWGTPVAQEDDAERAVRAALDLCDAVGLIGSEVNAPDLKARAGVHTGEAAVTLGAEGQGMVAGDLVNTASRIQSAAEPGTVLVGESTFHAASKAIAFEEGGEHALKGKQLPVRTWRAVRVVAGRQGSKRAERLEAPFVGRDEELRLIKDLFHTTARDGRPRLVSIMGVGGIGKSRLVWEFEKYIDGQVENVYWHQGRSPAYGEGVTFWPLVEMVQMRARIAETEGPESSRSKLAEALDLYVPDKEERLWMEPFLLNLLGLEDAPAVQREEMFSAWRTFFERVADLGPTVMVFEDLQWADPGQIDFIEHVLEWARDRPIFILTLARAELMDKRPTWGAGQRNFTSIHLEPLSEGNMWALLHGLVPRLPDDLVSAILERAAGVPLYAVETVRMLVDQGHLVTDEDGYRLAHEIDRLDVPDTLHALIAARLDALPVGDRSLLQDAAVLGKTFTIDALSALSSQSPEGLEPRLRGLIRKEILALDVDPVSPERGQYGFVQSLIREVAYQTLANRDRHDRHLAAARFFETLGDEELAAVVATHYTEAFHAAGDREEAEALAIAARGSLVTAAERAASLGSYDQALRYYERALEVTAGASDQMEILLQAGEAAKNTGQFERGQKLLEQALAWYLGEEDRGGVARSTAALGRLHLMRSRADEARALLEPALEDFEDMALDPSVVAMLGLLAGAFMQQGDWERAAEWSDRALAAAAASDAVPVIVTALMTKGVAVHELGRWREGMVLLSGAVELAEREHLTEEQLRGLNNLSYALASVDPRGAFEAATRGKGIASRLGLRPIEAMLVGSAADVAIGLGEWEWVQDAIEEVIDERSTENWRLYLESLGAAIQALRGDREAALSALDLIHPLEEATTDSQIAGIAKWSRSLVELAGGLLEESWKQALAGAAAEPRSTVGARNYSMAGRAALWLRDLDGVRVALEGLQSTGTSGPWTENTRRTLEAGLAGLEDGMDHAVALYREAAGVWRDLDVPFDLALCQLDFVKLFAGEHDAKAAAEEARAIFQALGATPFLDMLPGLLSGSGQ